MATLTASTGLRDRGRFLGCVAAAPALLLVARLLPDTGPGLALRLAAAAACVLIVPGALVLRAVAWPASLGVALAGSVALSLLIVSFGLAVTFAVGASIVLTVVLMIAVSLAAALPAALRNGARSPDSAELRGFGIVAAAGAAYAALVWWGAGIGGDGLFHLARARKLAELPALHGLTSVDEFKDGGLHPGYVFPLWHGVDALVARLAGVDVTQVLVYLPAILVPLALLLAYAAGTAVFRSPAAGVAVAAVQAANFGLAHRERSLKGTGFFESLSQPQAASHLILVPTALALAFVFIRGGEWIALLGLAAASFALSAVHPSYTPFLALLVAGFVVARVLLVRGWEPRLTRSCLALAGIALPFGLLLILLLPVVSGSLAYTPSAGERVRELAQYGNMFSHLDGWTGLSAGAIARGGPVVVAGLLAVPLAAFAGRRLWAALVLGGSLAILAVALTPPFFNPIADLISISQARRLPQFLPTAFAIAGACVLLARFRAWGVGVALAAGAVLTLVYPGEFSYMFQEGGPGWTVWFAVVGGVAALAAAAILQRRGPDANVWAAVAAAAFVVPVAVGTLSHLHRVESKTRLTPTLVSALRADVPAGDVVFTDPDTAYAVAAYAPVYVNTSAQGHVADTKKNQVAARAADAERFFSDPSATDPERRGILERWGADFVLVKKGGYYPREFLSTLRPVFEGKHFALYEVGSGL